MIASPAASVSGRPTAWAQTIIRVEQHRNEGEDQQLTQIVAHVPGARIWNGFEGGSEELCVVDGGGDFWSNAWRQRVLRHG